MIIYLTTNNIKNKVYVGKLVNENKLTYLGSGTYVGRAIKKYGKENFSRITLEDGITDHDYLCEREIYWIEFYDSTNPDVGYNLSEGGKSGFSGLIHTPETREKMSESAKNRSPMTEETCRKISENHADISGENHPMYGKKGKDNPNYGRHHAPESCKKMSENHWDNGGENHPMYGRHHTPETIERMSEAQKGVNNPLYGKHHTEETLEKMSEVKLIKKEVILDISKLLSKGLSVTKILKEVNVGKTTVYKVKNGWYNEIYDI